jgi:hypothetical protein
MSTNGNDDKRFPVIVGALLAVVGLLGCVGLGVFLMISLSGKGAVGRFTRVSGPFTAQRQFGGYSTAPATRP